MLRTRKLKKQMLTLTLLAIGLTGSSTFESSRTELTLIAPLIPPEVRVRLAQIAATALSKYPDEVLGIEEVVASRRLDDMPRLRKREIAKRVVERLINELIF